MYSTQVNLVKGKYPKHLIRHWEDYDKEKDSENDNPTMFSDNQLFIVLELKFAGTDMSSFAFQNAEQGYFAMLQVRLYYPQYFNHSVQCSSVIVK